MYGIEFVEFEIKDYDSGTVVFKVRLLPGAARSAGGFPPVDLPLPAEDLQRNGRRA